MTNLDGVTVAIVDDEPFMRKTIKAMLRAVGRFAVTEADAAAGCRPRRLRRLS